MCVCVYYPDSLINMSLCVGPVDLGVHGDGNQVGLEMDCERCFNGDFS